MPKIEWIELPGGLAVNAALVAACRADDGGHGPDPANIPAEHRGHYPVVLVVADGRSWEFRGPDGLAALAALGRTPAARAEDARDLLRNLLAVIHGDGGHHSQEHGLVASTRRAMEIVAERPEEPAPPDPDAPRRFRWPEPGGPGGWRYGVYWSADGTYTYRTIYGSWPVVRARPGFAGLEWLDPEPAAGTKGPAPAAARPTTAHERGMAQAVADDARDRAASARLAAPAVARRCPICEGAEFHVAGLFPVGDVLQCKGCGGIWRADELPEVDAVEHVGEVS